MDEPGARKVEAWTSFARNQDFTGVVAPACVIRFGQPVELGAEFERARGEGEWGSGLALQFKTGHIPENGPLSAALVGGVAFDLTQRETSEWFVTMPVTIAFNERLSLLLNAGWLRELIDGRSFVTWGAGFELQLAEPVKLIGEVFGQGTDDPATQLGLRYTPVENIDFDLIYSHNPGGAQSNWITLGINLRY